MFSQSAGWWSVAVALVLFLAQATPVPAVVTPLGDASVVNEPTSEKEWGPAISARPADGVPAEAEFVVSAYTTGRRAEPELAIDPNCSMVALWTEDRRAGRGG